VCGAARDDFDDDLWDPVGPIVVPLRSIRLVNAKVGMAFRLILREQDLAVTAAGKIADDAGMSRSIAIELSSDLVQLKAVAQIRIVDHDDLSFPKLVAVSLDALGVLEFIQCHPPPAVCRPNLNQRLTH